MTLAISNGHFLIADKRLTTTSTRSAMYKLDLSGHKPKSVIENYRDDVNKIYMPPNATVLGRRIKAFTAAGDHGVLSSLLRCLANNKGETQVDVLIACLGEFSVLDGDKATSFLFVVEGGGSVIISTKGDGTIKISEHAVGKLVSIGGSSLVHVVLGTIVNVACEEPLLLDVFLAATYNNRSCSTHYDAYSLAEHKVVEDLRPTDEACHEAYYRVVKLLSPMTKTKRHYHLPKKA